MKRWIGIFCAITLVFTAVPTLVCGVTESTRVVAAEASTEETDQKEGVRWFPVPKERQNDDAWEVECEKQVCLCQHFTDTPEITGYSNYLDTVWGEHGELTVTRNGSDGVSGTYWPRVRTVMLSSAPEMDLSVADTLYFNFDVDEGTTWNMMLSFNGFHIKLSKVIADATGKAGTVAHSDLDGGSGHFEGSINLKEVLEELENENGTESSINAAVIRQMDTTYVPQLTVYCVGGVGASLTINELFISTSDDVSGDQTRFVDMGLLTGKGEAYYEEPEEFVITEVDAVRWFPVPKERQNDDAWEAECEKQTCYCQRFTDTPATTGFSNYLDTEWGENGELTITRNGSDGVNGTYWPRIRTVMTTKEPKLNLDVADTLYFNFDVDAGTTWNMMLSFNGFNIKLSKVISDAVGKGGTVAHSDLDGGSGHFEGSISLKEVLEELEKENGTESSANAAVIRQMGTTYVPQLTVYCVGAVGASLTINELFLSTPEDTNGEQARLVDMGLLTGRGGAYYYWTYGDFNYALKDDQTAEIVAYFGADEDVIIPETIDGYKVTSIHEAAFYDCDLVKRLTIPSTVTSIEGYAFCGCDALSDIYYGASEDDWNAVSIGMKNEPLSTATMHFAIQKISGDMNGDYALNMMDALLLFGGINGAREMTEEQTMLADYNGDGAINMMDALLLYKRVSGQ